MDTVSHWDGYAIICFAWVVVNMIIMKISCMYYKCRLGLSQYFGYITL